MRIFIDESGNFAAGAGQSRTCCIGALVVPETEARNLLTAFVDLRTSWTSEPEIKSSALTDERTTAVLRLLAQYDVIAMVTAFDKLHHPPGQLKAFQDGQAKAFTNALTEKHNANAWRYAQELRDEWLKLSPQLMAQLHTLIVTIEDIIRWVPNYYAQHRPEEIGRWDWVIDPKDVRRTPYEKVWERIVCPILQTVSVEAPFMRITELDYSAFERFHRDIPDYVHPLVKNPPPGAHNDGRAINLNLLLRESVVFPDSRDEPGLQLADIVAGTFTKAMNGILDAKVWRLLGPLLLQRPNGAPAARLVALGDGPALSVEGYHNYVLKALTSRCKRMFRTNDPPPRR
jgi:hypothetical protein